jgi:plastocyanin
MRLTTDGYCVIRAFKFDPETVSVHAGDTVEWKNDDIEPYTATDGDPRKTIFDSGTIPARTAWR